MGMENRGRENNDARRIKPEILRDKASRALVEGLVSKLSAEDIDLRDQSGNPVNLNASEDIGMHINRDGNISLTQEIPESDIEQVASKSDERQAGLLKKMDAEKLVEFTKKMDDDKKDEYLEELAEKQLSYQDKLEEAEAMLKEAESPKEKNALEKKIADLRDQRDGYELLISAIEKGSTDIKRTEFKTKNKLEREIVIPAEITKEVFDSLPKNLQKEYVRGLEEAIDAGEKMIEEYKEVLETGDATGAEKKEAQARIREERAEMETKKKLIENLK